MILILLVLVVALTIYVIRECSNHRCVHRWVYKPGTYSSSAYVVKCLHCGDEKIRLKV